MTDITDFGFPDDTTFAHWLVKEMGVGGVPGSSFYSRSHLGKTKFRFMFSMADDILEEASERLMPNQIQDLTVGEVSNPDAKLDVDLRTLLKSP